MKNKASRYYLILGSNALLLLLGACGSTPQTENQAKSAQPKEAENSKFPLEIELDEVFSSEKFINQLQTIESKNDPVYAFQTKYYEGIDFRKVLDHYLHLNKINPQHITLVFECNDNYKIAMSLEKALSHHAYLAWRDVDAPKGEKWIPIEKEGTLKSAAPYFLVWSDAPEQDYSFVRPYGLQKIVLNKSH